MALLVSSPAAAFIQTRDSRSGKGLSWPIPIVVWHLNRDWPHTSPTCVASGNADPTLSAARASFKEWEQSCSDLRTVYGGTTSETAISSTGTSGNFVVFRRGWCSQNPDAVSDPCFNDPAGDCSGKYDCFEDGCGQFAGSCTGWGILAQTSVLYEVGTGRIVEADMEVNGWDGVTWPIAPTSLPQHGWYFTCAGPASVPTTCTTAGQADCHYVDLQNTVTHEAGHFIGLAHPCEIDPNDPGTQPGTPACSSPPPAGEIPYAERTMFPRASVGETSKRTLSSDDVAGVCAIYPETSSGGGCGCGSGGDAGVISIFLASLLLRRRTE